jgi:hypothetical protein
MEWFEYLRDKWNLDIIIIVLVFLSGFFQEKYLCGWVWLKTNARLDASLKTLVVSFVISTIYILITAKELKRASTNDAVILIPWAKYFLSYFAATSFYDMGIRPLRKWITKITGQKDSTAAENIPTDNPKIE